jgi:hypothetical protein
MPVRYAAATYAGVCRFGIGLWRTIDLIVNKPYSSIFKGKNRPIIDFSRTYKDLTVCV